MNRSLLNITFGLAVGCALSCAPLFCSPGDLSVDVPKTLYMEWLDNSTDPITQVDGDNIDTFVNYMGGPITLLLQPINKKTFLGIMCNSLAGYDITFTASNGGATAGTGNLAVAGGQDVQFNCSFTPVASTFAAGATKSTALDLTGATPSGTAVFATEADLPLENTAPNVWELDWGLPVITSISDGLIMSGTYLGGVTATVVLK